MDTPLSLTILHTVSNLTKLQLLDWVGQQLCPIESIFNTIQTYTISGPVDLPCFQAALPLCWRTAKTIWHIGNLIQSAIAARFAFSNRLKDLVMGWEVYVDGDIEGYLMPSHDQTMLLSPNVTTVGERLNECLQHLQQTLPPYQTVV